MIKNFKSNLRESILQITFCTAGASEGVQWCFKMQKKEMEVTQKNIDCNLLPTTLKSK